MHLSITQQMHSGICPNFDTHTHTHTCFMRHTCKHANERCNVNEKFNAACKFSFSNFFDTQKKAAAHTWSKPVRCRFMFKTVQESVEISPRRHRHQKDVAQDDSWRLFWEEPGEKKKRGRTTRIKRKVSQLDWQLSRKTLADKAFR